MGWSYRGENAWIQIADHFHQKLPDKRLDYQVGTAWPQDSKPSLHTALIAHGETSYPGFVVQSNGLNATGGGAAEVSSAATSGFTTGYQTAYYAFGDNQQCRMSGSIQVPSGTCPESILKDAVDIGASKQAKFIEFYVQDVNGYPNTILYAHQSL